jgi:hypothetical protein
MAIVCAGVAGFWLSAHGPTRAQQVSAEKRGVGDTAAPSVNGTTTSFTHIADAMLLPARLPFARETSLEDVAAYLRKELRANVVLDRAALERHKLDGSSKVQIDLTGVRLKTGLKLLLDQVGLSTRVLAEDNLLLITDKQESDEPMDRVLAEIKALHRDLHAVQDEIRDIRGLLEAPVEEEAMPQLRNPTIIEEKPGPEGPKGAEPKPRPKSESQGRTRPGA